MKLLQQGLITAAFVALLSLAGHAQATLKLADGSTVKGEGTRYDGDTHTLYFTTVDGRDLVLKMDQLDGRSAYLVNRSRISKDDASMQLQVANFARDAGLYAHSNRHYENAARLDPSLKGKVDKQVAIMHEMAAAFGMEQARAALDKGDEKKAEEWLTRILQKVPDAPQARQASAMLDDLYEKVHGGRDDHLEEASPDLLSTDLKRGKQYYDAMLDENKRGLQTKGTGQSRNLYNNAIRDGERALKEIEKVAKKRKDGKTQETLAGYRQIVTDQLIEIHLNLASGYMVQTSYNRALAEVNKGLALDPQNKAALAMRSRVEDASSRGRGWW